jgi:glycosyltransferase involved in cell wall biosynthesis
MADVGVADTTDGDVRLLLPDNDVRLRVPDDDENNPELSIVIPALDEALTIGDFVEWCRHGLADAGIRGEILIIDSSDDSTGDIALAGGARVLNTPKRGLGRAYIDALPFIRGRYVVMGDADCTYDFRELGAFVRAFRDGYEFVMGSRWRGSVEPGSMPGLHRYLGTPLTTWILNRVYGSEFSDIHCGMRGITRDALQRMEITSQSWEYASEMVLKSVHMGLRTTEVPVRFLKDREGRLSHHKRSGWFSPFQAAWINLRAMFVYGSDFFLFKPGILLAAIGLLLTLPVSFGDVDLGTFTLSLNWQFLGVTILAVGCQALLLGCIAQILFDYTGWNTHRWQRVFPYTRTVLLAFGLVLLGVALAIPLLVTYATSDFALDRADTIQNHLAVTGLAATITGAQLFVSTLVLHGTILATARVRPHVANQE